MTRIFGALALALCVAGCIATGSGEERFLAATRENVQVEGVPYHVRWLRVGQNIDFRTHRDQTFIFSPDVVLEQARSVEASMVIARRECRTEAVQAENVVKITEQMFGGRIRCG